MAKGHLNRIVQHLYRAALQPDGGELPDRQLLEAFVTRRDEVAFEMLLQRHGPMVMGVCRRLLRDCHDAEDAFQATFLVLVRKARSISTPALLGNWLYGVAYRTALEAKRASARRKAKERQAGMARIEAGEHQKSLDWRPLLDQELSRLPLKYRCPVVLCDLEGKTHGEAAQLLGCPVGTVGSRLARARARLAKRLSRHGLPVSVGALSMALSQGEATAVVSPPLIAATVKAASWLAAGQALTASVVSANVALLVKGVMQSMFLTNVKIAVVSLLVLGVAGAGGASLAYQIAGTPAKETAVYVQDPKGPSDPEKLKQEIEQLKKELQQMRDEMQVLKSKLVASGQDSQELLYQDKPASYWLKQLKDRDPTFRQKAIEAVGGLAEVDRSLIPVLIDCLKDPWISDQAARRLGNIGPPAEAAIPALIETVRSERPGIDYRSAIGALYQIDPHGKKSIPLLTPLLRDSDESVRTNVAIGLASAYPKLLKKIASENQELIPIYVDCLKRDHPRSEAMEALAAIGADAKSAVPAFVELSTRGPFNQPNHSERRRLLEALEKIDPEAAAKIKAAKSQQ
jgi:RNA polymerase sigma factor (sigma-70 family)